MEHVSGLESCHDTCCTWAFGELFFQEQISAIVCVFMQATFPDSVTVFFCEEEIHEDM